MCKIQQQLTADGRKDREFLFKNVIKKTFILHSLVHVGRNRARNLNNHHFVGHCGKLCGLKWSVWRSKIYFVLLKLTNAK